MARRSGAVPAAVHLGDATGHDRVEAAVVEAMSSIDLVVTERDDPVDDPRSLRLGFGLRVPGTPDAARLAVAQQQHLRDELTVATLMQNVGPLVSALGDQRAAVVRLGPVLLVKADDRVVLTHLDVSQQMILDHQPDLARSPREVLAGLAITPTPANTIPSAES